MASKLTKKMECNSTSNGGIALLLLGSLLLLLVAAVTTAMEVELGSDAVSHNKT